jgi:hypothetical protein
MHNRQEQIARTERLVEAMRERLELLQELQALLISGDIPHLEDGGLLLALLGRKSAVIDRLNENQAVLREFENENPEERHWQSPQRRAECQQLADGGARLLREIIQSENLLLNMLTDRRDAIAAQLQQGRDLVLAAHAYSAGSVLESGSLDILDG